VFPRKIPSNRTETTEEKSKEDYESNLPNLSRAAWNECRRLEKSVFVVLERGVKLSLF
jgi:hypothetical protein